MTFFKKIFGREIKNTIVCALKFMPDDVYLKIIYRIKVGKKLDLKRPKTYTEKLQWLKLHDRKPVYTTMVDKYAAKQYITSIVGEEYVIPTLGVWEDFDSINFKLLPDKFVLKCTHDSGGLVICKNKAILDIDKARKKIEKSLKTNFYWVGREWPYKNVKPQIIAEKYMANEDDECLTDYKFFCFNGEPRIIYVSKDKAENPTTDFFDENGKILPIRMRDPNSVNPPKLPEQFDEMKKIARKLSKGMRHLRVDFYIVDEKIYVGELTFYHNGGFSEVKPEEWNYKMGSMISID